jgi:hypothetical protein
VGTSQLIEELEITVGILVFESAPPEQFAEPVCEGDARRSSARLVVDEAVQLGDELVKGMKEDCVPKESAVRLSVSQEIDVVVPLEDLETRRHTARDLENEVGGVSRDLGHVPVEVVPLLTEGVGECRSPHQTEETPIGLIEVH